MARRDRCLNNFIKDENGGVLILVAFLMVVLLGMSVLAIDVGSLYQTRRQMVNAADAAALAGAQEMILNGNVQSKVDEYAITLHSADDAEIVEMTTNTIKVKATKKAPMWFYQAFASLLGNGTADNAMDVSAEAKALIYTPEGVANLVPIAVTQYHLDNAAGGTVTMTSDQNWDPLMGPGNFGFVQFSSSQSGASILGQNIKYGYPEEVNVGDPAYPETGQNVGQVRPAVNWRADNAEYVIVPIIDYGAYVPGSSDTFNIIGFAAFVIDNYVFHQGEHRVTGTFTEYVAVGSGPPGSGGTDYGVFSITLIE